MNNSLKNWKEPRNTTEIQPKEADNIDELLLESQEIKKTLNPEHVKMWKESLENVVIEINLLRESVGLKIISTPNILFYKDDNNKKAFVIPKFEYKGKKIIANGRLLTVNMQFSNSQDSRVITHILAHEMVHFADSIRIFNHKFAERNLSGVDFDKLTLKSSETPYLEEKIILSEKEIEGIKNYLALVGTSLAGNQKTLMELVLQKRQEIGFQPIRDIENKLSLPALKFLNHFVTFKPEMLGFEVWQKLNIENIYNYDKKENDNYIYYLTGLLDKANQKNWLNEGLCDFLGNFITDKILGKVTLEEEKNKEVGYPEYFWKIHRQSTFLL